MSPEHLELNRSHWDARARAHVAGYRLEDYVADPGHLSEVVRFDLPRLGTIAGRRGVHLMCHVGTDTLSLARLGARMTGLDFSPVSLAIARQLATDCGASIDYVEAELERAPEVLEREGFDFVYTGVGALCWLPDIARWAAVVASLLRPGGMLFLREGHPMLWTLSDPRPDGLMVVEYPYFERGGGTEFAESHSYVEHAGAIAQPRFVSFNHGLGETVMALMRSGLSLRLLEEHDSVPWNPLGPLMEADAAGEYRLTREPWRLAASYTLVAVKS